MKKLMAAAGLVLTGCATDPAIVERFTGIEADVEKLEGDLVALKVEVGTVRVKAETVAGDVAAVKAEMNVGGSGVWLAVGLGIILLACLAAFWLWLRARFYKKSLLATCEGVKDFADCTNADGRVVLARIKKQAGKSGVRGKMDRWLRRTGLFKSLSVS